MPFVGKWVHLLEIFNFVKTSQLRKYYIFFPQAESRLKKKDLKAEKRVCGRRRGPVRSRRGGGTRKGDLVAVHDRYTHSKTQRFCPMTVC